MRAGSVCSDAPRRSACISLGACPCTLRHRKAPGAYRKVLEEETSHKVRSQTLTCWVPMATGSLLLLSHFKIRKLRLRKSKAQGKGHGSWR